MRLFLNLVSLWIVVLSADLKAEPPVHEPQQKLEHLIEAVEELKKKTIPQAYFLLESSQLPISPIFFPDSNGGGYLLMWRRSKVIEDENPIDVLSEIKKKLPKSQWPSFDEKNRQIVYYSEQSWATLKAALKPWSVSVDGPKLKTLDLQNSFWKIKSDDLLIKIPSREMKTFYASLLKGWQTNEESFRGEVKWN